MLINQSQAASGLVAGCQWQHQQFSSGSHSQAASGKIAETNSPVVQQQATSGKRQWHVIGWHATGLCVGELVQLFWLSFYVF